MTIMHISSNTNNGEEDKKEEELVLSNEDPVIKGNKHLSVEVKLCDLIRYGALG